MNPENVALTLLDIAPRKPARLRQAIEDGCLLSRREAREVLRRLVDQGRAGLGWDGLIYLGRPPGPGSALELEEPEQE